MKKLSFLAIVILSHFSIAQSVCNPNGITTNPTAPVNVQQPSYLNYFNWATLNTNYAINSTCSPNTSTPNPFQSNQLELLPLSLTKDNKPVDGWEMVAYNLGFDNNNILLSAKPEHTYIMLYNKYTGKLRILLKWCRNINYNGALLRLEFTPGYQSNLLDMSNDEKAMDTPHITNPSISTVLKFYNDNNSWGYADFKLNYDPCTCAFSESSRLALYTELITKSSVALTGKLSGTITSIDNGTGTANADGNFWKTADNINNKMMQAHKGVQSFADNYTKIYKNLSDGGVTVNAITQIGNFLNNNSFMKAGLKALPYVSEGVKFLTGLFGGGDANETPQPLQLAPMSVNLDVKINGTITTSDPMHNVTIGLPGSQQQNALPGIPGGQPLYNETLGVFALLNHPVMYYTDEIATKKAFTNRYFGDVKNSQTGQFIPAYIEGQESFNFNYKNYKLSGDVLKYAINPASGLTLQDAEIIVMVEYEKNAFVDRNYYGASLASNPSFDNNPDNGSTIPGTARGPVLDQENFIFQNAYKPIGSLNYKNNYSFHFLSTINKIYEETKKRELIYNAALETNPNGYSSGTFSCATSAFDSFDGHLLNTTVDPCNWSRAPLNGFPFAYEDNDDDNIQDIALLKKTSFDRTRIYLTARAEFLVPKVKSFKLKLVLNLKRTDIPTAQNVLYVVTYPIELKPAPAGYNMTGDDIIADAQAYAAQTAPPAVPTNMFIPATQAELVTLCSSTIYKDNRNLNRTGLSTNKAENESNNQAVFIFPNPNNGVFDISFTGSEKETYKLEILNMLGQTIYQEIITNDSDTLSKTINLANKKDGIYMIVISNGKNQIVKKMIVK